MLKIMVLAPEDLLSSQPLGRLERNSRYLPCVEMFANTAHRAPYLVTIPAALRRLDSTFSLPVLPTAPSHDLLLALRNWCLKMLACIGLPRRTDLAPTNPYPPFARGLRGYRLAVAGKG